MELVTLNSNFQPEATVDTFESLIWAERYSSYGDFEITSSDINTLVKMLPRESYVSLRDSNHVMIVEDHKLVKPLRDKPMVSITGRSFETVLERRASVNTLLASVVRAPWLIAAAQASDAAYLAIRIVIGDAAQYASGGQLLLPATTPAVSPLDALPMVKLVRAADYIDLYNTPVWDTATTYAAGQRVRYAGYLWSALVTTQGSAPTGAQPAIWQNVSAWGDVEIKPQDLYATVMELITTNHHGIKATRPGVTGTQVNIEIFNGADISDVYVVDARFDQIDDATYLLSERGSTNVAYVYGSDGAQQVLKTTTEPSGLVRRVLALDGSSDSDSASVEVRRTRGLIELYKYNATALFDGEVAAQVAAGYNKDYFLGDIMKLIGEYGLTQKVRVAEFIRTQDSNGIKSYPTFEAVDE